MRDYPPYEYFMGVLEHYPQSAKLYFELWNDRDFECKIVIDKNEVRNKYFTTLTRFKNQLMMLVREGLANVDETPTKIKIELTDWNMEHKGCTLC